MERTSHPAAAPPAAATATRISNARRLYLARIIASLRLPPPPARHTRLFLFVQNSILASAQDGIQRPTRSAPGNARRYDIGCGCPNFEKTIVEGRKPPRARVSF